MKSSFIIAVVFAAFSSSALAAHVPTSNNAAIHCDKMRSDVAHVTTSSPEAHPASVDKTRKAK